MTKAELLQALADFPDDAQVFVWNPWSVDFDPVTKVESTYENGGEPLIVARD
jgi:hypothetical protein